MIIVLHKKSYNYKKKKISNLRFKIHFKEKKKNNKMDDDNNDTKHENGECADTNASRFFKIPAFWHTYLEQIESQFITNYSDHSRCDKISLYGGSNEFCCRSMTLLFHPPPKNYMVHLNNDLWSDFRNLKNFIRLG